MSYLDIPRIHFSGRFFTDPSTVNNDPNHYKVSDTNPSPWQTPMGQHRFQFRDVTVMSVMGPNGFVQNDPVIGTPIISTDQPIPGGFGQISPAKLVDLDVYQQAVSTIYGLQLQLTIGTVAIQGVMEPASLNMCWVNSVLPTRSWGSDYGQDSNGGDMNACGIFQSVLKVNLADWPVTTSPIITTLRNTTLQVNGQFLLSIKFTVDGYQNVPQDSQFLTGRLVGAIGPVFANEPLYNPGQRWMSPRPWASTDPWNYPSFNNCPFKVDATRNKLVIDLSNSLCRESAGGNPVDLKTLQAFASPPTPPMVSLGTVDYSAFAYDNNAQIAELPLNPTQLAAAQTGTLSLVMSRSDVGPSAVLTEPNINPYFAVEKRVIRMAGDTNTTATTTVYVSNKGKPLAGKQLKLFIEPVYGNTPGATVPPVGYPGDTPSAVGAITGDISVSDANGIATVTLKVLKDPGFRTEQLDGQLYFIVVFDPAVTPNPNWSTPGGPPPQQDQMISLLVFSQYPVNQNPEWPEIQKMMVPYMKLFPFMRERMDLTDEHTFTIFSDNPPWFAYTGGKQPPTGPLGIERGAIPYYMSLGDNDPRLMPLTRDLSPAKVLTIMYFCKKLQAQAPPNGVATPPTTEAQKTNA